MALNVTFNGFLYNEDGSLNTGDAKYQALFYPNGTASSPTTWNDVRSVEATGYWNINLGDGDWLTQDGTAISNSKIVIVFWRGTTTNRNDLCANLTEWGATEITHNGSSVYTLNTQTKSNIDPVLAWTLASSGLVGTSYSTTNTSYDVHSWVYGTTTMNHWRTRYGQNIQLVNTVDSTDYNWNDGNTDLDLSGAAAASHVWSLAGTYTVIASVTDSCGAVTSGTKTISIYNNAPVPGIICHQTAGTTLDTPNTVVTFAYSGTDEDNKITSIDWTIEDTGSYGNTTTTATLSRDDVVGHTEGEGTSWYGQTANTGAFTNPGDHVVSIVVHWNDGFSDQVAHYSVTFTQEVFTGPTVTFEQDPAQAEVDSSVNFNNTSTNTSRVGTYTPSGAKYYWTYDDSGTLTTANNKVYSYIFSNTPTTDTGTVTLAAYWNDGWENHIATITQSVAFATVVTISEEDCYYNLNITGTSDDGTATGYHWEVYKDESGSWTLTWESPTGLDQNDKKVCFTSVGDYRIYGFVHGTGATTDAYVDQNIDLICPTEAYFYIWNGTGVDDIGGDWLHSGFGVESTGAMRTGTNGLDLSGMKKNSKFEFARVGPPISTTEYDLIALWLKVISWPETADIEVSLHNVGQTNGVSINISSYTNIYNTGEWQRVLLPLSAFEMDSIQAGYIDELQFKSTGNISIYLDDIMLGVGSIITRVVTVDKPNVYGAEFGEKSVQAHEIKPTMRVIPTTTRFPGPTNL